jgi:HEPN superfamily AbiU2-like protein
MTEVQTTMIDPKNALNEFYNLCFEARCDFDLYRSLYENDHRGTQLCVNLAPYFFNDIGRIITRMLVLHICRLTDPAGSGSKTNLTTNYILQNLPWPVDVQQRLEGLNAPLMAFRAKLEPARSKRIAHVDLHSQVNRLDAMGRFNKGEDAKFFIDLQSFYDVAYRHVFNDRAPPFAMPNSTDTINVIRAVEKATLFDRCYRCDESVRATDLLDLEGR